MEATVCIVRWMSEMMWYINTMKYYVVTKKNVIMPFAPAWMDLEMIILSEVSYRKANICGIKFKKMKQMNLLTKQR